jgi:hypothetical protein
MSGNKLDAIMEHVSGFGKGVQAEQFLSYLFPISKYRQNWKTLTEFGFSKRLPQEQYVSSHGFVWRNYVAPQSEETANFTGFADTGESQADYIPEALLYATKMVELCKQNNIAFVLYKTPHIGWSKERHNAVQAFADQNGVQYIDFNMRDILAESGISFATIFFDDAHVNIEGAIQVSRWLGKWLRENYALPYRKGDPGFAYLDADYARYEREARNAFLVRETNMMNYLNLLTDIDRTGYTVLFSIMDDGATALGDELRGKLAAMGFQSKFDEYGHSFIGVWQDGQVVYENRSATIDNKETDMLEYVSVLPGGQKYYVKSAGYKCGNESNIIINGADYSKHRRGFNIAVYDNTTGRVVDAVCWDTWKDAGISWAR